MSPHLIYDWLHEKSDGDNTSGFQKSFDFQLEALAEAA